MKIEKSKLPKPLNDVNLHFGRPTRVRSACLLQIPCTSRSSAASRRRRNNNKMKITTHSIRLTRVVLFYFEYLVLLLLPMMIDDLIDRWFPLLMAYTSFPEKQRQL